MRILTVNARPRWRSLVAAPLVDSSSSASVSAVLARPNGTEVLMPRKFGTDKAERMEIVAGSCSVKLDGSSAVNIYGAGTHFDVPAKSGFDIEVTSGIAEYICSFIG